MNNRNVASKSKIITSLIWKLLERCGAQGVQLLVQIVLAERLTYIDISVRIPVLSMAICFGMTALTKLLVRGKELKDDNDLFI